MLNGVCKLKVTRFVTLVTHIFKTNEIPKPFSRGCKPRPASTFYSIKRPLIRDGVYSPVTHVLKAIETFSFSVKVAILDRLRHSITPNDLQLFHKTGFNLS